MADLNTQIMEAIQNYSDLAPTIKQRYSDQPAYEAETRETLFGNDQGLSSALSGFSDKVKELYTYDQSRATERNAAANQMTTQAGEIMPVNPMIQERANQESFMQTVDEKEKAWQLYETRKNILGDALDKAIKKYEAETNMKLVDKEILGEQIKMLKDMYSEEQQNARLAKQLASDKAIADMKNGGASNVTGSPEVDAMTDLQVKNEFIQKYGARAYDNIAATQGDRVAAARALLGLVYSGTDFNAKDLMNDSQLKGQASAESLLSKIIYAQNKLTGESGWGGTGLAAGVVPTAIAGNKTKELRTAIAGITPEKIKELSGVAVSDREYERLKDLVPSNFQTEEENLRRVSEMAKLIQIGLEIQNKAVVNNVSLDKAYDMFGPEVYQKYGVEWRLGTSNSSGGVNTNSNEQLSDDEIKRILGN